MGNILVTGHKGFIGSQYDLSILIPARNEMFVAKTVQDILQNKRGKTEIIVGLDGAWAEPGIDDHPDVRIVHVSESIGQRALTNRLCHLSNAKYVAKCDAHVAFDEGFDQKLIDAMQGHDDWTITPAMKNLHAFDWKCPKCGSRWYQGPTPTRCMKQSEAGKNGSRVVENLDCDNTSGFIRKITWEPNHQRPTSTSFRFDRTLHFQYFKDFSKRPEGKGDITPTLSLQGSFFMMTREKYWALNICDEEHGSWGQQGVEVACKTWLSGGEVMCLQTTWYAHMFRTQGGDFSFPYRQNDAQVKHAREYSRDLFIKGQWPLAIHDLQWLLDKFAPVPDWEGVKIIDVKDGSPTKGIIYYTDNQFNTRLAHEVQHNIRETKLPITSASLKPMDKMGNNLYFPVKRGKLTMFMQILACLEAAQEDVIFFCEHDVLYHSSHFDFTPNHKDKFYYNQNFWRVREDGFAVHWDANQVSGLVGYREHLLQYYRGRIEEILDHGFDGSYEPGGRNPNNSTAFKSEYPNIDIRFGGNTLTRSKWSPNDFRDKSTCINWQESTVDKIPGWENLAKLLQ